MNISNNKKKKTIFYLNIKNTTYFINKSDQEDAFNKLKKQFLINDLSFPFYTIFIGL